MDLRSCNIITSVQLNIDFVYTEACFSTLNSALSVRQTGNGSRLSSYDNSLRQGRVKECSNMFGRTATPTFQGPRHMCAKYYEVKVKIRKEI